MSKKRLLAASSVLSMFVGAMLTALWVFATRPAVTKANFDRIENGMTKAEVEGILGCKNVTHIPNSQIRLLEGLTEYHWDGHTGFAAIDFDEFGRVFHMRWAGSGGERETWFQELRAKVVKPPPIERP